MNITTQVLFVTLIFFKKSNLKTTIKKKKIHPSGFDESLGRIFCLSLVVEFSSLEKIVGMLEDVLFSWREVRCIYYRYTQIPQSFTSSQCRNPQCALLIHSA